MSLLFANTLRSLNGVRSLSRSSLRLLHSTPRWAEQFHKADGEVFSKALAAKDRVVLVDFYADWCGPCRILSPILEKVVGDPSVRTGSGLPIDLVTLDTETNDGASLGQKYKVRSLPTVIAFSDGKPINQFVGAMPEEGVLQFIKSI